MDSKVINLEHGHASAFRVLRRFGHDHIVFANDLHRQRAERVKNPGSFGAALLRQALAQGLAEVRREYPHASLAGDVRALCTHSCDVRVTLTKVEEGK